MSHIYLFEFISRKYWQEDKSVNWAILEKLIVSTQETIILGLDILTQVFRLQIGNVLVGSHLPDHNDGQTIFLMELKHCYNCFFVFSLAMKSELVRSKHIIMGGNFL